MKSINGRVEMVCLSEKTKYTIVFRISMCLMNYEKYFEVPYTWT
jgi:hypothetical protein